MLVLSNGICIYKQDKHKSEIIQSMCIIQRFASSSSSIVFLITFRKHAFVSYQHKTMHAQNKNIVYKCYILNKMYTWEGVLKMSHVLHQKGYLFLYVAIGKVGSYHRNWPGRSYQRKSKISNLRFGLIYTCEHCSYKGRPSLESWWGWKPFSSHSLITVIPLGSVKRNIP